jgi:hypothetical protein
MNVVNKSVAKMSLTLLTAKCMVANGNTNDNNNPGMFMYAVITEAITAPTIVPKIRMVV